MDWLTWLMVIACAFEVVSSWIFRKRLRRQHQAIASMLAEMGTHCQRKANEEDAKANDEMLLADERARACIAASFGHGCAHAYADAAKDLEWFLVQGKPLSELHDQQLADLERSRSINSRDGDA